MNVVKCKVCFGEPGVCDCPNGPVTEDNRHAVESETPRTDAAIENIDVAFVGSDGLSSSPEPFVNVEFSRQLERELNEAKKMYSRLRKSVNGMAPADLERLAYFEANHFKVEESRDQWRKMAEELAAELNSELLNDFGFRCSKALSRFNEMKKG